MTEMILELNDVVCGYGAGPVLRGISFSLAKGHVLGILGPNGSGKTTLFRAVGGMLPLSGGKMTYKNRDLRAIPLRTRAQEIAFIPQFFSVPFRYTVEEVVMMGRYPHKSLFEGPTEDDRLILDEVLRETDIADKRDVPVDALSGGELQRAVLAQGLCQQPQLLLLDEPVSHLDIGHQVQVLDLITRLRNKTGLTVAVILHDLNMAALYCDALILMDRGQIVRQGLAKDVLTFENIESVYKTTVIVKDNPITGKPNVFPIPEIYKHNKKTAAGDSAPCGR